MGDTADSCTVVVGSGCGAPPEPGCVPEDSADTGARIPGDSGVPEGGGCEMEAAGVLPALSIGLVFGFISRRIWAILLIALVCDGVPTARAGVQADAANLGEGGDFGILRDADIGAPGTVSATVALSHLADPVHLHSDYGDTPLLSSAWTLSLGGAYAFGGLARVGVSLRALPAFTFRDVTYGPILGDTDVWITILFRRTEAVVFSGVVFGTLPTGVAEAWLGEPNGRVGGAVLAEATPRGWRLHADLALSLATPTELPGLEWSNRVHFGLGVRRALGRRMFVTAELFGSKGITDADGPNDLPIEADLGAGVDLGIPALSLGVGRGLTAGVGAPENRVFLAVDLRRRNYADTDGDGIVDPKDRCVVDPEDMDRIQDRDGCPETDADADGLADEEDRCPVDAEVKNGFLDDDGCPDNPARVRVTVRSADAAVELQAAEVRLGTGAKVGVLGDEQTELFTVELSPQLEVTAPGFVTQALRLAVGPGGRDERVILLEPVRWGEIELRARTANGPVAAWWKEGEVVVEVPVAGTVRTVVSGAHSGRIYASGHRPVGVTTEVPTGGRAVVDVLLEPIRLVMEGGQVQTELPVGFRMNSDAIVEDDALETIVTLLALRPDIRLLRVEGHADAPGTSAYNLDLSRRRAEAARDWLVAHGVDAARLEVIGSGESRAGPEPERMVTFRVIVWDDTVPL